MMYWHIRQRDFEQWPGAFHDFMDIPIEALWPI